jgi:predicted lysophospholipase L1 biosynthesis ABC-type transport system permease subunit
MTLTLASMQFSPRILVSFVRDRVTQWTLGVFLGTFLYCMAALPAARSLPQPFAPVATVTGALALALTSVIGLIFFIPPARRARVAGCAAFTPHRILRQAWRLAPSMRTAAEGELALGSSTMVSPLSSPRFHPNSARSSSPTP